MNNRYEDEIQDPRFKFSKTLHERNPHAFSDDPIESISVLSQSPEAVPLREELPPSIRGRVHESIPLLIPEQQELYWRLSEGRKLVDIAKEEGTTDNAIRSRRRKMIRRIQRHSDTLW
ncbi:hypothetical protein [Sphaerochaeta sp. PS]|uniref:hypothetical protein n=1 Tax=Sphaerochaeta sp. PS TaxID=3076336 RepID=UPI0028A369C7|nr:hypothetical protein [Sphaerochaeta sp. PS]MDT4761171.1 hypothetical protein [Sphaerochaeta sp. PS]